AVDAVVVVGIDGASRQVLGHLPTGKTRYDWAGRAFALDDDVLIELTRTGDEGRADVYRFHAGLPPALIAEGAVLVKVFAGRVVVLVGANAPSGVGDLRTSKLDGQDSALVGGGDGQDRVAEVADDHVLATLHSSGAGDVAVISETRMTRIGRP